MKEKIARNWEKIALGISAALLVAYLVIGVGMAKKDTLVEVTNKNAKDLKRLLEERPVELPEKANIKGRITGSFGPAMAAAPGEQHVYTRVPELAMNVEIIKDTTRPAKFDPKMQPVLGSPVLAPPVVEPGSIQLTWTDASETKNIKPDDMAFTVYRKGPDDKDFKKISPDPVTDRSFTDAAVDSKKEYAYVVAVQVSNAEVAAKLSPAPPGDGLRSEPQTVTAAAVLELELKGVAEIPLEPDQPPVPTAQLMVKKFIGGSWKSKLYLIRKGDKIGTADLATGFSVEDLARVTVQRTEEYTVPKFDDKGVKVGEETKKRTREVTTWELKYKDDAGKIQNLYPVTGKPRPPAPAPAPATPK